MRFASSVIVQSQNISQLPEFFGDLAKLPLVVRLEIAHTHPVTLLELTQTKATLGQSFILQTPNTCIDGDFPVDTGLETLHRLQLLLNRLIVPLRLVVRRRRGEKLLENLVNVMITLLMI